MNVSSNSDRGPSESGERQFRRVLLLTGFGPFGKIDQNPSQIIAERLDGRTVGGWTIVGRTLPVAFGKDTARLATLIEKFKPAAVLSLGVAASAEMVRIETVARNHRQAAQGRKMPILAGAPMQMKATLPGATMRRALRAAGLAVRLSEDAGDYLCNHTLFQSLRIARQQEGRFRAGFLHLPLPVECGGAIQSNPALARLERGVRRVIAAIAGAPAGRVSARGRAGRLRTARQKAITSTLRGG